MKKLLVFCLAVLAAVPAMAQGGNTGDGGADGDYIYQMGTATTFGASSVYTYNLTVNKTGITLSTASITAWTTIGAVNGVAELQ